MNPENKNTRGTPVIYFNSLNRPFTVLGVERSLFYLFVSMSLPIAFSARLVPVMDGVAFVVFLMLYTVGILMTRKDGQLLGLYRRHIQYKKYYAPHPHVHASFPRLKPSVPFYQGKRGWV